MADPSVVDAHRAKIGNALNLTPLVPPTADDATMEVVEDAWRALHELVLLARPPASDQSVVDALNTLREAGGAVSYASHRNSSGPRERYDAALSVVETALADHKPWLEDELDECDKRADRAEARAVAAEAKLRETERERDQALLPSLEEVQGIFAKARALERAVAAEAERDEARLDADETRTQMGEWLAEMRAERDTLREALAKITNCNRDDYVSAREIARCALGWPDS